MCPNLKKILFLSLFFLVISPILVFADQKIVLKNIDGRVKVQRVDTAQLIPARKGMVLNVSDQIQTGQNSSAEIVFAKGRVVYIRENSLFEINDNTWDPKSGSRIQATLRYGDLMGKIKKLPKDELFQIKTPTAIAGIRGTIFYLNVFEKSKKSASSFEEESLLYSGKTADKNIFGRLSDPFFVKTSSVFAQDIGDFVTELFVEQGRVMLENIISNLSELVGAGEFCSAHEDGLIEPPVDIPEERRREIQQRFVQIVANLSGGDFEDDEESEDEDEEEEAEEGEEEGDEDGEGDGVEGSEEAYKELQGMEETIIEQLSDLSVEDLLTLDSLSDEEINELLGTDLSAEAIDIILDTIDERTQNALEDYLDLQAIRDDLAMLLSDISFSDFEAELAMREDFMTGKTLRDRFGQFVRSEQYVLNNSDIDQIQIVSVTARLGAAQKDAGVTAISVKFNFNDLSGVTNIRSDLPWKDILGIGQLGQRNLVTNGVEYSNFGDPGAVALSSVKLEMFNPLGDNIAIKDVYQGVTNPGTFVQEIDMSSSSQKVNGVQIDSPNNREFLAQKTADNLGWLWWMGYDTSGQSGFFPSEDEYIQFQFYWINDQGDIQDVQTLFDGIDPDIMPGAPGADGKGPIQNIQDILNSESGFNLQFRVTSTEFPNNEHIDAVFDPALITPYVQ